MSWLLLLLRRVRRGPRPFAPATLVVILATTYDDQPRPGVFRDDAHASVYDDLALEEAE